MTSWRVPSWPKICCTMCPAGTVSGIGIGGLELVDTIRIVAGPAMTDMVPSGICILIISPTCTW